MELLLTPTIRWKKAIRSFLIVVFVVLGVTSAIYGSVIYCFDIRLSAGMLLKIICCISLIAIVLNLKRIIIFSVLLYQKFAPDHVRLLCRYTPSCSTYMIMAINKYGVLRGVPKGIKRLLRCRHPNGGIDFP